jgi:hypothetical protein
LENVTVFDGTIDVDGIVPVLRNGVIGERDILRVIVRKLSRNSCRVSTHWFEVFGAGG